MLVKSLPSASDIRSGPVFWLQLFSSYRWFGLIRPFVPPALQSISPVSLPTATSNEHPREQVIQLRPSSGNPQSSTKCGLQSSVRSRETGGEDLLASGSGEPVSCLERWAGPIFHEDSGDHKLDTTVMVSFIWIENPLELRENTWSPRCHAHDGNRISFFFLSFWQDNKCHL